MEPHAEPTVLVDVQSLENLHQASTMSDAPTEPHATSQSTKNGIITLQVGERRFIVASQTLIDGSEYFKTRLSTKWSPRLKGSSNRVFFIDMNGNIFAHILHYLRSGIYPLLYDVAKGFDLVTYTAIRQAADYLGVLKLVQWIDTKRYLKAVKFQRKYDEHDGQYDLNDPDGFLARLTTAAPSSGHTVMFRKITETPHWSMRKIYVCPRDIAVHRDNPAHCGKDCARFEGDYDSPIYDEELHLERLFTVEETVVFNHAICMDHEQ